MSEMADGARPAGGPGLSSGTIVRLVRDRGFGFIREEHAVRGAELFFHAKGVTGVVPFDPLDEGQRVYYRRTADSSGRSDRAIHVQLA